MSSPGRSRSRSIRESFSKLRRQISSRSNRKETHLNGIEVDSEDSPDLSTESYSPSYSSSEADFAGDAGLENFLMPSPVLDNLAEEDALTTSLNRYGLLDEPFFDSSQPFRFLDLPLEIRRLVYQHYFPQPGATLRIKRGPTDSLICNNPWHETQAILSTCREIHQTAEVFSQIHSATLDLSHYTVETGDVLPISNILSKIGEAGKKCSRLILSSEQPWNILEPRLFPLLSKVEVWDYSHWRSKIYIANSADLAADFEGESRRLLKPRAEVMLANNKLKVPDGVVAEINFVCDVLVCVGPDDALRPRQDKLRHILSFSDTEADGTLVKVDWAGKHDMGPLPLRFQMAPHMHEYCLHLREHEPELLDRAS